MLTDQLRVTAVMPASADRVYAAWLDGEEHARMTGSKASVDARVGGEHSAWDGYIEGRILELEPGRRIVQSWRTTEFPLGHPDSRLEVHLLDVEGGCEVMIVHTEIPEGQGTQYESGWRDHYFEPMAKYFGESAPKAGGRARAKKKPATPKKTTARRVAARRGAKAATRAKGAKEKGSAAKRAAPKRGARSKKAAKKRSGK